MEKKTCFVISPIGEEGSDIRKHADAVYENIIEHVFDKNEWRVWRSDHRTNGDDIAVRMLNDIRSVDLCIVVLTGFNPNVMFEYGIRLQTGKDYILIKDKPTPEEKEKQAPFDIYTKVRLEYDYRNQKYAKCIQEIKDKVTEFLDKKNEEKEEKEVLSDVAAIEKNFEAASIKTAAAAANVISDLSKAIDRSTEKNKANTELIVKEISDKIDALTNEIRKKDKAPDAAVSVPEESSIIDIFIEREIMKEPIKFFVVEHMINFMKYFVTRKYSDMSVMYKEYLAVIKHLDVIEISANSLLDKQLKTSFLNYKAGICARYAKAVTSKVYFNKALESISDAIDVSKEDYYLDYNHLIIASGMIDTGEFPVSSRPEMEKVIRSAEKIYYNEKATLPHGKTVAELIKCACSFFYERHVDGKKISPNSYIWEV